MSNENLSPEKIEELTRLIAQYESSIVTIEEEIAARQEAIRWRLGQIQEIRERLGQDPGKKVEFFIGHQPR